MLFLAKGQIPSERGANLPKRPCKVNTFRNILTKKQINQHATTVDLALSWRRFEVPAKQVRGSDFGFRSRTLRSLQWFTNVLVFICIYCSVHRYKSLPLTSWRLSLLALPKFLEVSKDTYTQPKLDRPSQLRIWQKSDCQRSGRKSNGPYEPYEAKGVVIGVTSTFGCLGLGLGKNSCLVSVRAGAAAGTATSYKELKFSSIWKKCCRSGNGVLCNSRTLGPQIRRSKQNLGRTEK